MTSKVDGANRPTHMMTKRDSTAVLHRRWPETVIATLCVVVEIAVLLLKKWTRPVRKEINGFYGDRAVVALSKSIERLANATRAVGRILGLAIGEFSDTINGLLGVDLIAAINDVVADPETGPCDGDDVTRASKAKIAVKWQDTVGHVLGKPSHGEHQERARQWLINNSLRHDDSDVRPEISQRSSRFVNERTTGRGDKPEKHVETITDTPQPTVLKIDELTYDTLPSYAAGPIASVWPDKMAEWRREKFFADVAPTDTAFVTDGLDGGAATATLEQPQVTPANRYGRRKGRHFTIPSLRHHRRVVRPRAHATTRPRARDDAGVASGSVPPPSLSPGHCPFTSPPPPSPVPFSHGRPEQFACPPPPPSPVPSSHGRPGPFTFPSPPGPVPFSHGQFARPPPTSPVPSSHRQPGPFAYPPPPSLVPSLHGRPGQFSYPPPPGPVPSSHGPFACPSPPSPVPSSLGQPGPFVCPLPPGPVPFSPWRPEPFVGPPPPGLVPYSYGQPGPFADPKRYPHRRPGPIAGPLTHGGFTRAHMVSSRHW